MKSFWLIGVLLAVGCDDTLMSVETVDTAVAVGDDYCAVQGIFSDQCLSCHSASAALGDLDLETDAYGALVGVQANVDGKATLVVADDPSQSLLYTKMTGTQGDMQGDPMPPAGQLDAMFTDAVAGWITSGATEDCD
jgi:hypothetical protein